MKLSLKKLNKRRCIIVLAIFLFLFILIMCLNHKEKYEKLTVLFNNNSIELISSPIIENENIYISKEDIQSLFDKNVIYNEIDQELITTFHKNIAFLKLEEPVAQINDEEIELNGVLKVENNIVYIPISDLASVYDLEVYYSPKSNRIIMDSTDNEKIEVDVKQRTSLKKGKGIFSKKLETLIIGDKLVVMENEGSYKKVRSPLGNIGYVKVSKVSEETKVRENVNNSALQLTPYFNYSNSSGIYDNIEVDKTKRNVVLPEFFVLEKEGKLLDKTNITTATYSVYKKWTENNGLEILPTFTNNANVSDTLLTYEERSKIINELKEKILEYGFFGINIEFKTIDDFNSFYRLVIELTPRFKNAGLNVIVTIENNNLDRQRLENIVDLIIEE